MEKYIPLKPNKEGYTHIEVCTRYVLGDWKWQRGYYLHIAPVERIEFPLGSGLYGTRYPSLGDKKYWDLYSMRLIKEVSRQSKKAEAEAEQLAIKIEKEVVDYICKEMDLVLSDN